MSTTLAPDPLREAFRRRAMGAADRMAREASPEALTEALAAPTDSGSVARLLADDAAGEALRHLDPLAGAIARGAEVRANWPKPPAGCWPPMPSAGCWASPGRRWTSGAAPASCWRCASAATGTTRRRNSPPMARCSTASPRLVAAMPEAGPWSVLDFLLAPDAALGGRSPLAAMRGGDLAGLRRLLAAREADSFG